MERNVNGSANKQPVFQPLLTESAFAARLGIGERKFKQLRAAGLVPEPLRLGPRASRWTEHDYEVTLTRLPRREQAPEPETLAQGRRARIEKMKAGVAPVNTAVGAVAAASAQ